MELFFLAMLIAVMIAALGSGYPVAFALPGSAILTIGAAALAGYLLAGDASAYFAHGSPIQWLTAGVTNFRGVYWEVERDTLIAIPLFIFMGIMLQRSRIAEDLLVTMAQLFGPMPGGLGISVVFVGALLAATTGIVGATVVAMGLISLPAMLQRNYSHTLATGTIAASGTLGQIIPPSIVLIILADQLSSAVDQASSARKALYKATTGEFSMPSEFDVGSTSAGDMFMGAFVPGLVLVGLYMLYILALAVLRPKSAPAVHFGGAYDRQFAAKVVLTLVPPLALIFLVLGSIIMGIATVNQAGAIGAVGAAIMAGYRLHPGDRGTYMPALLACLSLVAISIIIWFAPINIKNIATQRDVVMLICGIIAAAAFLVAVGWSLWRTHKIDDTLRGVMIDTAKTTSLVFIILLGAAMLTAAFRAFGGEELVREFLTGLPGGFWTQFIIVMAVIFLLGFFLDFIEIAVVVVPIVAPILLTDPSANITAVWLGVMIGLNIQTSFLTPPFGFALFYLRGVAPAAVRTIEIYKGVIPFICLQLLALAIVGYLPSLVNYLPNRLSLTSVTAPPPVNPRLQACIEENVLAAYRGDTGTAVRNAITEARKLDLSYLPEKLGNAVSETFDKAEATFQLVDEIARTEAAVTAATGAYRPVHIQVRQVQLNIAKLEIESRDLSTDLSRLRGEGPAVTARRTRLEERLDRIKDEIEALRGQVPGNWESGHKAFVALQSEEKAARAKYRRNVDEAYAPIKELLATIEGTDRLAGAKPAVEDLRGAIASATPDEAGERISEASRLVATAEGTGDIRKALSAARSAIKNRTPDAQEALRQIDEAIRLIEAELAWRQRASAELLGGLRRYDDAIRSTIGLRSLPRLPREQALDVAACQSHHRDLSLGF